ncbi:MAG: helix-turn-helix transcriptional regulator [Planctomycetota bacterium]
MCVLLAQADFDRLISQLEAYELAARASDPDEEWITLDDFKVQLAASRLVEARKARGMTQVQLARRLGLPQSQISRIERNPDHTTVRTLKRIAAALHVDVGQLLR